jgi:pimeloyl-ACP methyl ester carboxylesterase
MVVAEQISIALPRAGITVRGQRFGQPSGKPTLCLHGWLDNSASFEPLAAALGGLALDIVAVDLPGHGWSEPVPSVTLQYLDYVAVVLELVAELGWTRFHLIGHSLGGALSVLTAGIHPDKISKLVLIDAIGPLSAEPESTRSSIARYLHAYLDDVANPVYDTRMQAVKARMQLSDILMSTAERLLTRDLVEVPGGFSWRSAARLKYPFTMVFTEEQVLEFIRGITAPVLLVSADRTALGESYYPKRIESVPNLRHVVVEGGHHVHMENVRPVAEFITEFLKDDLP